MKTITKYVANDGCEFTNKEDAVTRDEILEEIKTIIEGLPQCKERNRNDFVNGHGYIQHTKTSILNARQKLLVLAKRCHEGIKEYSLISWGFGRYLDDNSSPLYSLYIRLVLCIDEKTWREYGQPYFTNHTHKVENICLNP